jgi:hypothetical protein
MDANMKAVASACIEGLGSNTMTAPQACAKLADVGFERMLADFCRGTMILYTPEGESLELPVLRIKVPVTYEFDAVALKNAIEGGRQALTEDGGLVPGFSYNSMSPKMGLAGAAGYMISFPGRFTTYFGRTGEAHVEPFPPIK